MMVIKSIQGFIEKLFEPKDARSLAIFRVVFGTLMFLSTLRFVYNGWVHDFYIAPSFHFTFYLFEWIKPMGEKGMYVVFLLLLLSSLMVALGLFYSVSIIVFFLLFTYIELIDKTYYLNHYYFISLVSFLLCFVPANARFSLDNRFGFSIKKEWIPYWTIFIFQLQIAIVYFFAGLAKVNSDWLFEALPLRLWLPTKTEIPVIGSFLSEPIVAYLFSWAGMLFDVSVWYFLWNRKTVWFAYFIVVVFHLATAILFPMIGVFPFVMIGLTTLFLPFPFFNKSTNSVSLKSAFLANQKWVVLGCFIFFSIQLLLPFRYLLYPGSLFVTEEGYRFSWRVMLMEKAGFSFFKLKDKKTHQIHEVNQSDYLNSSQQKQMNTQPDMLLQFAHHLQAINSKQGKEVEVYVESYVSINGRGSRLYLDSTIDLSAQPESFFHKKWILE